MIAPHLTTNLEMKRLDAFLQELQQMFVCIGITDSSLQEHAGPPHGRSCYYRHMSYRVTDGQSCFNNKVNTTPIDHC